MKNNSKKELAQTLLEKTLKDTKKSFIYVGFFSFFINLLMLVPAMYMLQVYDRVMSSRSLETLLLITIIMVFLFATMGTLEVIRSRILVRIGNKLDTALSSHLFDVIFHFARLAPSKASSIPLSDLTKVRQFMTGNGVFAFFDSPWFPIYVFIMYLFSPWLALFGIFAACIIFTITLLNEKTTKKSLAQANETHNSSLGYINKNIANAEIIHAMGMGERIKHRWLKKHLQFLQIQTNASDMAGRWANTSKTTRQMFQSLTYGVGAYLAINGEISSGMIIAGAVLLGRALQPLDLLTNTWKQFSDARESYYRLNDLLKSFPEIPETMELPAPKGEIRVENIVVVPPASAIPALKNINMLIPQGTIVSIIGPSASGKSTLVRSILGVWPLYAGKVRLDGADIHRWNSDELGEYIGYLPQDIELFEGNVSENIARFGEIKPDEVVEAAKIAGVHEMILRLPQGYDTAIGVGGMTLSGGQRQRIGLARALYKKPPVIVLDEPNSNLDEEGEKALLNSLLKMKEYKSTIVLVTHRPSILSIVDKIAVLSQGNLTKYGDKDEVIQALKEEAKNFSKPVVTTKSVSSMPKITKPGE